MTNPFVQNMNLDREHKVEFEGLQYLTLPWAEVKGLEIDTSGNDNEMLHITFFVESASELDNHIANYIEQRPWLQDPPILVKVEGMDQEDIKARCIKAEYLGNKTHCLETDIPNTITVYRMQLEYIGEWTYD